MCILAFIYNDEAVEPEESPQQATKCKNQHAVGSVQQELYMSWDKGASASSNTSFSADASFKHTYAPELDLELMNEEQQEGHQPTHGMHCQQQIEEQMTLHSTSKEQVNAPRGLRIPSAPPRIWFLSQESAGDDQLMASSASCLTDCSACSPVIPRDDATKENQSRFSGLRQRASSANNHDPSRAEQLGVQSAPSVNPMLGLRFLGKHPALHNPGPSCMSASILVPPALRMLSARYDVAALCASKTPAQSAPISSTNFTSVPSTPHNTTPSSGKLLVVSPGMPDSMQRSQWSLSGFWICKRLYNGYASSVYHAIDRQTSYHVALKIYHTGRLEELNRYQVLREIFLHSQLQHENILQMYAAFQDNEDVVMVLDYASGGDLYGLLKQAGGRLPEEQALDLVLRPFLAALTYLHGKGIVHRDIKPENMLLSSMGTLKIADFGLAIDLNREKAVTRAGTLDYMAPEVLRCPPKEHPYDNKTCKRLMYNQSVDVWAVGVLAYELLVGFPPFSGSCPSDAMSNIMSGAVVFPKRVTPAARHFVEAALQAHPGDRPTVTEMAASPWISRTKVALEQ